VKEQIFLNTMILIRCRKPELEPRLQQLFTLNTRTGEISSSGIAEARLDEN